MTKTVSLDQELLSTLTDEERAAIEDASDEEIASLKAVGAEKDPVHTTNASLADADDPDDEDKDDDQAADTAAAAEEGAAPAVETLAAEAVAAEPAPAQAAATTAPAASYHYELPADFDERKSAIRTANAEALDKFEAGEMTREELLTEQERIAEERRSLDAMQTRADIARDMQAQQAEQRRQQAVEGLFNEAAKPEAGGIDYRKDATKFRDLDTFVKALAADESNADKPLNWFLDEAHRRVKVLHGIGDAPKPTPTTPKTPAQIKAEAVAARKPDLGAPNADLSQVPGGQGDGGEDVGGEFADIMSLEGDAFESAIARMAKTQPDRWARFQAQQQ